MRLRTAHYISYRALWDTAVDVQAALLDPVVASAVLPLPCRSGPTCERPFVGVSAGKCLGSYIG